MIDRIAFPLAIALAIAATGAANAGCVGCYERVVTPPVYGAVQEQVMVSPPRTVAYQTPAEYGSVTEQIVTRPARTFARHTPPIVQTVSEQTIIQPARKVWSVTRDQWGREIGCWVVQPAVYGSVQRQVVVSPGSVAYETEPAEYATVTRPVQVRPAQTYYASTPATYATQTRQVMVSPGQSSWQPLGSQGYGYGHRGYEAGYGGQR